MTRPASSRFPKNRSLVSTLILVIAVLGFMAALFASVLTNLAIQQETQRGFQALNVASRQQTLIAQVVRQLYELRDARRAGPVPGSQLDDLNAASTTVTDTFKAFAQGGTTEDEAKHRVSLDALPDDRSRGLASHGADLWAPIAKKIADLGRNPSQAQIADAITAAHAAGDVTAQAGQLRDSIAAQTNAELDELATRRLEQLLLSVLCFVLLVSSLFSRVSESQKQVRTFADDLQLRNEELAANARQLTDAKRGTDLIMETVTEGLMLIDAQYRIQPQYSRELEKILQAGELAGQNLLNVLQRILTERMYLTSRDYLGLLFDAKKKERTVLKVNPLDEVEVSFPDPNGGFVNKFLSFNFRRIVVEGVVNRVFVSVTDISDRIKLETQLRDTEEKKDRQFDFLFSILHVDPRLLDEFITNARAQVQRMNEALRSEDFAVAAGGGHGDQLRQRLDVVFRCVHSIKGSAALLNLERFQGQCEIFETRIAELRNRPNLSGDDFLSIVIAQSELRTDLDELEELRGRFRGMQRPGAAPAPAVEPAAPPSRPAALGTPAPPVAPVGSGAAAPPAPPAATDPLLTSLNDLIFTIAMRTGKDVRLDAAGFETEQLDPRRRRVVMDVLSQLVRNSVTHGIESPADRQANGKPKTATITVRDVSDGPDEFRFRYRDDGVGLDPDRIRSRAASLGLLSPEDAAALDDGGIAAIIFAPGFSTADEPTTDAGRGMGMSVIKERVVDESQGEIAVSSEPGRYCEFEFTLPSLPAPELAPAAS
jgi:HPt (histidine-containing phosphotransfer) domain-containing protein/type II secretory pathway pseudopilin PulG